MTLKNITITGFQVEPHNLTAVCGVCGALLGDIDKHDDWHGTVHADGSTT